jgi:hypothetical protein
MFTFRSFYLKKLKKNPEKIFLFPFWLPLEREASTKLPVSLQFLNLGQSVGLLGRVISSSQDHFLRKTAQI